MNRQNERIRATRMKQAEILRRPMIRYGGYSGSHNMDFVTIDGEPFYYSKEARDCKLFVAQALQPIHDDAC